MTKEGWQISGFNGRNRVLPCSKSSRLAGKSAKIIFLDPSTEFTPSDDGARDDKMNKRFKKLVRLNK